ncbi:RagB/SusD family nutrient uptake outer membrane protein [Gemmatimonadota bacterium]
MHVKKNTRNERGGFKRATGILALGVLMVGCEGLLDVDPDPQTVDASSPIGLTAALVGANADFTQMFDSYVVWSGLFNDEIVSSGTAPGIHAWDRRDVPADHGGGTGRTNSIGGGNYSLIQRAVAVSDIGQERIRNGEFTEIEAPGTGAAEYARFSMLTGFGKTFIGDFWCSTAFGGVGPELSSQDVYAIAEAEFTEAINATGADADTRSAALVGRARVRLQMGNESGALSDAQQVDPGFEAFVSYSTNSFAQRNRVHFRIWDFANFSIGPAFRDLTLEDGSPDPRVELVLDPVPAFEPSQALYAPLKVPTASSPLRYASGDEAQYIIAEIQGGAGAVQIINDIRARHGISLTWTPTGGDPNEIRDKVIDERKRTLFLDGTRQGDVRRYLDKYGLDFFPTSTPQGFAMGNQVCLPLPEIERNNNPGLS